VQSEGLKDWVKRSLHGNLVMTQINRNTKDEEQPEEGKRVMTELIAHARKNLYGG